MVFPGVQDPETLETISRMCGEFERPEESHTEGISDGKRSESTTTSTHTRRVLKLEEIKKGVSEDGDRDVLLCLNDVGHFTVEATPYWRAAPWPQVLTECMLRAQSGSARRWLETSRANGWCDEATDRAAVRVGDLPIPDLGLWATRVARQNTPELAAGDKKSQEYARPWHVTWAKKYADAAATIGQPGRAQ